jgi:hypothetical protein
MKRVFFVGVSLFLAYAGAAQACSICKCGDQSFFINSARLLPGGKMIFSFEHLNLSKSSGHVEADRGHGLLKSGSPVGIQHLSGTAEQVQNTVQASLLYGISNRLTAMASVPYIFNQMTFVGETEKTDG